MQRDARSGGRGGVGRTAVGARGHGGGVEVGGGVPPRRGFCAVLGDHLSECRAEEEGEEQEEEGEEEEEGKSRRRRRRRSVVYQAQQTPTSNLL